MRNEELDDEVAVPHVTIDEVLNQFTPTGGFYMMLIVWCGLTYMSESVEINLLGFLSTCAGQDLAFTNLQTASISSVVFAGEFSGAIVWAICADVLGRRRSGIAAMLILVVASWIAGAAPSFSFLFCARFFVGFGIGGACIPLNTLSEYLPLTYRGMSLTSGSALWAFGGIITNALAWTVLSTQKQGDWRTLAYLCALLPTIALIGVYMFVPESARWLLAQEEYAAAEELIRGVAKTNGDSLGPFTFRPRRLLEEGESAGRHVTYQSEVGGVVEDSNSVLTSSTPGQGRGRGREFHDLRTETTCLSFILRVGKEILALWNRVLDLFRGDMRDRSVLLTFLWATKGACYYGGILFMDRLYEIPSKSTICSFQYAKIIVNSTSELVGVVLLLPIIDNLGRVKTLLWTNVLGMIALVLLLCDISTDAALVSAWFMRLSFSSSSAALVISTLEMYTTKYRVTAFAFFFFLSRVGTMLSTLAIADTSISNVMVEALFLLFMVLQTVVLLYMKETKDAALDSEF